MPKHSADHPDESVRDDEPVRTPSRSRPSRRVTTNPPPGSDPHPLPEPSHHRIDENDDTLRRDVPPHY